MKQYQIIIRNTNNPQDSANIFYQGTLYALDAKNIPAEAGYNTRGAAKRIATIINKDPESNGLMDSMVEVMDAAEIAQLVKDKSKDLTKQLMEKYYPEKEAAIREEYGQEPMPKADKVKKERKPAQPKRIDPTTITPKQEAFIKAASMNEFYKNGDGSIWLDVLVEELEHGHRIGPMTAGAMVSTLREKGLITVGVDVRENAITGKFNKFKYFSFTDTGREMLIKYGFRK